MTLRLYLNEIIKERNMSQRELAHITKLCPNTLSHFCSDKTDRVYLDTLERVFKALGIKGEYLIINEKKQRKKVFTC